MAAMDWTYPASSGDAGIFEIGRRLAEALGRAPDATSFTYDPRAMLRTTREIERVARGGHLLVGFQKPDKLVIEADRYVDLLAAGTDLTVWAIGPQSADPRLADLDYREARRDTSRLDAQWFLVSDRPEPLAFVSYELGDPASFGVGGAATPGSGSSDSSRMIRLSSPCSSRRYGRSALRNRPPRPGRCRRPPSRSRRPAIRRERSPRCRPTRATRATARSSCPSDAAWIATRP